MDPSDKIQAKVELIYRLWAPQSNTPKSSNSVQFQPSQNLDALIVYNQEHNLRQKLSAYKVLPDAARNKDFFDLLVDPEGLCMTRLLNGYNTALITYGLTGRGKTHSWIGADSIYNETRTDFNVLTKIYGEMKKSMPNLGISLSLAEISYNDINKSENTFDLLDPSGAQSSGASSDFSSFCSVAIRSQHELEKTLRAALKRSSNWIDRKDLEKSLSPGKIEYRNNTSHLLCRLNFVNTTQKKQFSFYLVDLIGINNDKKDTLTQMSLNHINKFIDELSAKKEDLQGYKQERLERISLPSSRNGSYNALVSDSLKIVDFLGHIVLNSQTFFFVPFYAEGETYKDTYSIFERCFKLSTLRLAIETESIDNSKKVNLIAFQSFAKQNDISINDSYTISRTPMAQNPAFRQDSAHFSNIEGLSPINNRQNTGRGIYIQDNSTAPTPFRGMTPAQPTRLNQEVTNTMERINMLQKKAEEYRTLSPGGREAKESYPSEQKQYQNTSANLNISTQQRGLQGGNADPLSAGTFGGPSPKARVFSPNKRIQELLVGEQSAIEGSRARSPPVNRDSYYVDYNQKVKETMGVLDDFMVSEINTLKKEKLPAEYYLLRRNFDILYRIFKEGEVVSNALTKDFLDLGSSIKDFKQDYDEKLIEAQQNQQELQLQFTRLVEEKGLKDVFEAYERDIEKLIKEGEALKDQNMKIVNEIQEYHEAESRSGVLTEFSVLNKKHNHLVKQYGKAVRHLNEVEEEIAGLRKKDRLFTVEKRMSDTVQVKIESLAKKVETQEEKNKALAEKLRLYEEQNRILKDKVRDQDSEVKRLSTDYFKAMEKAALYKEMAKTPTDTHVKIYKEARESVRQEKLDKSPSSKRVKDLDSILNKLKSFDY